ncbi:hypothetical protein [Phyllobacterium sp. 22552]|uniref:hypothetical protein n=1 Tax=Phyllobacterium sp. 22552 TaxID=3453941 RepID=UPI003F8281CB
MEIDMPVTEDQLKVRQAEIHNRIDVIVRERIECTLAGTPFVNGGELSQLYSEATAISEALPIAREREATNQTSTEGNANERHG